MMKHLMLGTLVLLQATPLCLAADARRAEPPEVAERILSATGVRGGLVVHLGCGDGRLTAALHAGEAYLVHGLARDPARVAKARARIREAGLYGPVSVAAFGGRRLPYADNLVNLLVAEDLGDVPTDEVQRVLVPGGVAYVRDGGTWTKTVKPWPNAIDEWTHFLHGPDGNAVARDRRVGPPEHVQWLDGPVWSRHHDTVPSVNALVWSGGRIFYLVDEAPACIGGEIPDQWSLAARDAFNGVLLWKRPVDHWGWKAWSGTWKGRFNQPNHVPKRLVASGDRLFCTPGFNAPLAALDAATGETVRTYPGTEFTDEILYHRETLVLSINHGPQKPGAVAEHPPVAKSVAAVDPETGRMRWKTGRYVGTSSKTGSVERVSHLLLAARGNRVFLADSDALVALDLETGDELWIQPRPERKRYTSRYHHLMSDMCTLVATDDLVLFAQLEPVQKRIGWGVIKTGLYAFSAKDGRVRWSRVVGNWGHFCVPDVFVVRGLVWVHDYKTVAMVGLDPHSGEEKARISTKTWFEQGHHHRCYRNKATERFILTGYRGVEFLDLETGTAKPHHWSRGACRYGILPAGGLLYSTPHPCECYIQAKLNGLYALAPANEGAEAEPAVLATDASRIHKGPAFGTIRNPKLARRSLGEGGSETPNRDDWPTYRHDAARSGSTPTRLAARLAPAWRTAIGGRLSPPVVADGRLFVSAVDAHTVHALDAGDGTRLWSRAVGGRVDSPPTVYGNLVLFGCADGSVTALKASDGRQVWRLEAAPADRRVVAFGRIESAWPVHGSVLVRDGVAWFAAGRSSYLDGGIRVCSVDPMRGTVRSCRRLYSPDPETGMQPAQTSPQELPGALTDILVGSGRGVTMRHKQIDAEDGSSRGLPGHLLCTSGFLDDAWFNRTKWSLDGVTGRLLVFDEDTVCGVRAYGRTVRWTFFFPGKGYGLFAAERRSVRQAAATGDKAKKRKKPTYRWQVRVPVRVRGMVLAGDRLVLAGPPDTVDTDDPWAAFEGRLGGRLWVVSTSDGTALGKTELDAPPTWDGMAAADGRLYMTTVDGHLVCLTGGE
ncbi:MAG: PQQ-binding-like beta-propeller repeat protein [Phycisphaerae bacterium]